MHAHQSIGVFVLGLIAAFAAASVSRGDDDVARDSANLRQLLRRVEAVLPTRWRAEITPDVPIDAQLLWRNRSGSPCLTVWRTAPALGIPSAPGMPGGTGSDNFPWEEVVPRLQLSLVEFLSEEEFARKATENRRKQARRIDFIERQLSGIERQTKNPYPYPPHAFHPKTDRERELVRQYALVWMRTEPDELPTHHDTTLAFILERDEYSFRDRAVEREYDAVRERIESLVTPYRLPPATVDTAAAPNGDRSN
jgi:hypothetical protein